jgi:hypothetical protein
MFALLPLGALGMGLALSLGMSLVSAYAVWGLSSVTGTPLRAIGRAVAPAFTSGLMMAGAVFLLDRRVVHAELHSGVLGIGLLAADGAAAAFSYLGFLVLLSRSSAAELKELVQLLIRRVTPSATGG